MIAIRDATIQDINALTLLLHDLGYPCTAHEVAQRFNQISQHADYKTLVAVDEHGYITGMIGMCQNYFYEHNGQYIRILAMVVGKAHQNQGIGKILMAEAELWAKQINSKTILLNSGIRPERHGAYQFYQKMGFEIKTSGFIKILP